MPEQKMNPTLKVIVDYAVLFAMAVLMALNYQIFILHNAFAPSGINGLATMIQYTFNFSVGYFSLAINVPLAIICARMLPMAVASVGPASTRRPVVFATSRMKNLSRVPPPRMLSVSKRRAVMDSSCSIRFLKQSARES